MSRTRWTRSLAAAAAVAVLACGITLREPLVDWWLGSHGGSHGDSAGDAAHYTCSMDPSVRAREPGQCPICGMALTPVTEQQRGSDLVHVDGASLQRIGVRVATAGERSLRRRIVAVGAVAEAATAEGASALVDARVDQAGPEMTSGRPVAVQLPALPLVELGGAIEQVSPDPDTGGARLRVAVQDPGSLLRPGMHAEVQIYIDLPDRLVVPARAVIVAGERRIVFVDRGKGLFEPRAIATGVQESGLIEVRKGLVAGDRVVMSGTFLLAAENRIRSSGALWTDAEKKPAVVKPKEKP